MAKKPLDIQSLKHKAARRRNIPTAEFESVMREEEKSAVRIAYERRNRDLDPQLVWRGKDEQDWSELVVAAPPLYIQEKVHPKVLIDDLVRRSRSLRKAALASSRGAEPRGDPESGAAPGEWIASPSARNDGGEDDSGEAVVAGLRPTRGDIRHGFVYERVPHVTLKSIANNAEIDVIWEKWQATLESLREKLNAALKQSWQEWEIPREAGEKWAAGAKKLHADWWEARIARQKEIDASIAAKAEFEFLYDKPYEDRKKVRVAGPFTVESLSPHRVLGVDEDDVEGHIGMIHDAMFRAVRLVVDSGMHDKKWSREQAVKYYVDTIGDQEASAITEIERYVVWPGQACSYMVGKIDWMRLRAKARKALGRKFDLRRFHDTGLLSGGVPLTVLEKVIDGYIASAK